MDKFIKKNWFVCILIVIFAGISVFYIYDTNKGKLKGKTANGEGVVYSVGDTDVTATDFYNAMYEDNGPAALYQKIAISVADQSIETTDEMKENAKASASQVISNYASSYPTNYREMIGSQLVSMGYSGIDDLETFLVSSYKQSALTSQYIQDHFDEIKPRNISYILIKFENGDSGEGTPTEDEQKRMDAVDEALASGTFEDAAKQFSEDPSTSETGGVLGTLDANTTSLDSAFQEASLALKEGEVSDWVYSSNFGYFKIKCNASTHEGMIKAYREQNNLTEDIEVNDAQVYDSLLSNYDTTLTGKAVWEKAQELGLTFTDPATEEAVRKYAGMED